MSVNLSFIPHEVSTARQQLDESRRGCLFLAAKKGDLPTLQGLLVEGTFIEQDILSAIREASLRGNNSCIEALKGERFDVVQKLQPSPEQEIRDTRIKLDELRRSGLCAAARGGDLSILQWLLDEAPFSDADKYLAERAALERGNYFCIEALTRRRISLPSGKLYFPYQEGRHFVAIELASIARVSKSHNQIIKISLYSRMVHPFSERDRIAGPRFDKFISLRPSRITRDKFDPTHQCTRIQAYVQGFIIHVNGDLVVYPFEGKRFRLDRDVTITAQASYKFIYAAAIGKEVRVWELFKRESKPWMTLNHGFESDNPISHITIVNTLLQDRYVDMVTLLTQRGDYQYWGLSSSPHLVLSQNIGLRRVSAVCSSLTMDTAIVRTDIVGRNHNNPILASEIVTMCNRRRDLITQPEVALPFDLVYLNIDERQNRILYGNRKRIRIAKLDKDEVLSVISAKEGIEFTTCNSGALYKDHIFIGTNTGKVHVYLLGRAVKIRSFELPYKKKNSPPVVMSINMIGTKIFAGTQDRCYTIDLLPNPLPSSPQEEKKGEEKKGEEKKRS